MEQDSRPSPAARFPSRATSWLLRTRRLELPRRPLLMGIVNVTPDSFSDGGLFAAADAAVEHALRLAEQGRGHSGHRRRKHPPLLATG